MIQTPCLLRPRDAATYSGVKKSTLDKLRCTGGGPRFTRRGSSVYYAIKDLDSWIESMPRFSNTSEADTTEADTANGNEKEPES